MRAVLRAIYVALMNLRGILGRNLAALIVGKAPYQTVRFDGLTIRDFGKGSLTYLMLVGELDWYRQLRAMAALSADHPVILDIGGNVGAAALPMSQVPGSKVVTFEPFDDVAALLRSNLEVNGATNVELRQVGMSDTTESVVYQDGGPEQLCHFSTVDVMAADMPVIDFMKIDTDGYDFRVLTGAMETVKRCRPVMITEFISRDLRLRSGEDSQRRYAALLEEANYEAFVKPPFGRWRMVSNAMVATGTFNTNLLLLPRGSRPRVWAAIA